MTMPLLTDQERAAIVAKLAQGSTSENCNELAEHIVALQTELNTFLGGLLDDVRKFDANPIVAEHEALFDMGSLGDRTITAQNGLFYLMFFLRSFRRVEEKRTR